MASSFSLPGDPYLPPGCNQSDIDRYYYERDERYDDDEDYEDHYRDEEDDDLDRDDERDGEEEWDGTD